MVPTIPESLILHNVLSPAHLCVWGTDVVCYFGDGEWGPQIMCGSLSLLTSPFVQLLVLLLVNSWLIHFVEDPMSLLMDLVPLWLLLALQIPMSLTECWSPTAPVIGTPHPSTQQPCLCLPAASIKYPVERVCACWGFPRRAHSHWPGITQSLFFHFLNWSGEKDKL